MQNNPQVRIYEVGPRDGLQNEKNTIDTSIKIELIQYLLQAGLRHIEIGAFVSPKWVPQMADTAEIARTIKPNSSPYYSVLTPNIKGLDRAIAYGIKEVAVFASASESFSQKNINCSIEASIQRFQAILASAQKHHIKVRAYISCVLGCPYEGDVPIENVVSLAKILDELGCYEISLGDTIGVGTPYATTQLFDALLKHLPAHKLAGHFHNTYGMAIANIYAALQLGIRTFDSAIAGLGGCPYANGATGNVPTEDLVYFLQQSGFDCGIDLEILKKTALWISHYLNKSPASFLGQQYEARKTCV